MNILVLIEHVDFSPVGLVEILVLISEWGTSFERLLLEFLSGLIVLFHESSKLSRDVEEVLRGNLSPSVLLTMSIDIGSMEELFIEHHDDLGISFTNNCSSCTKWKVLS